MLAFAGLDSGSTGKTKEDHLTNRNRFLALTLASLLALPLVAQDQAADDDRPLEEIKDVIVVTASRTEQHLHDVPASISVLTSEDIEQIPADDYGDLLRNIPGVNVTQLSARDIQLTTRSSTNSLAASQLVLVDGRTLYLDFFGFVMWDFLPSNPREIKQIEVVRGPGAAVWGANAMSGVINVITKSPREMVGTDIMLGAGELGTVMANINRSGAKEKSGYKIGFGYYEQDPYDRPTGFVPGTASAAGPGTPYPTFVNGGTDQPKFNARYDYDKNYDSTWSFSGGFAATDGIVHSGIGPFDITSADMTYFKADWTKLAKSVTAYVNILDGDADNQLTRGVDGQPLAFLFETTAANIDIANTSVVAGNNILTYGGNVRQVDFDLSIAPGEDSRSEFGVYLQDEILMGDKWRWLIGARFDDIDPIGNVISPRTSLMYSPSPNHTYRASFNRAFKSPSLVNNYLDIVIINAVNFGPLGLYIFPSVAGGNVDLVEEQLDAIELGYLGTFGNKTVTFAVYENDTEDSHDFFAASAYTAANPPPGFPLPAILLDLPPGLYNIPGVPFPLPGLQGQLPASFSYRNIGSTKDRGAEFSLDVNRGNNWSWGFNYSYQDEPEVEGVFPVILPSGERVLPVNIPPQHRANINLAFQGDTFFFNTNANYQDEAFWTDILDSRFYGPTDSFTMLNAGFGWRLNEGKTTLSLNGQNLTDEDAQQHVFGDIISRKVVAQVAFAF